MSAEIGRCAFSATAADVPRAVAFVLDLATGAGASAETVARLELAVEEWVVNLCRHAYDDRPGAIEISVRRDPGRLLVEIADQGPPFDPTSAPGPDLTAPLEERAPGGMGLPLIRRMTEEFRYRREDDRNVVTLAVPARHS